MFAGISRNNRLIMLALFVWALGEGLWYYNLRQLYLVELGATEIQLGNIIALESAFRALMPIPAGYIADRFGPRRVMITSWVLGIIGTVLSALAHTWEMAIPGLMIYALSGFAVPSISAFVLRNTSGTSGSTDRALALVYAVYPAGLIVSPTVGGLIADALSIRALLWLSSGFFVASAAVLTLTRSAPLDAPSLDDRPIDLLRNRPFLRVGAFFFLTYAGLFVGYQLLPNFLRDVRGLTYSYIGLLFSIGSVGSVAMNLLIARTPPRWNGPLIIAAYSIAILLLWQFDLPILLMLSFLGVGAVSSIRSVATARFADVVSPRNRGLAFGALETILSVAVGLAGGMAGRLYVLTPAHDLPFIVVLVAAPVLAGLWFVLWASLPAPTLQTALPVSSPGDR